MNKTTIKKYAVWARKELLEKIGQKAQQLGVEENEELDLNVDNINGILLSTAEKNQRQALIRKIQTDGYSQVMEEVAYTWFNRFIALRFMEINNYLPIHIRVFTDEANTFNPQILTEALHLEIEGVDKNIVIEMKSQNKNEELFKYLLIAQCNALNSILPNLFEKIADYTELLLPDYLLRDGSVIEQMISLIPEEDWTNQVQIIGWLYQYYNDELKDEIINIHKGSIAKDEIPAATQLFTTDWVVKYIVDNSLGKMWLESHPESKLKEDLQFYIKQDSNDKVVEILDPKDIKVIDPSMGSGHFLVYVFDLLLKIYSECGYSEREAASLILKNNIYGLEIDNRAAQLASFALIMKARQVDRRFFSHVVNPDVIAIKDSKGMTNDLITYIASGNEEIEKQLQEIKREYTDGAELGALLYAPDINYDALLNHVSNKLDEISMWNGLIEAEIMPILHACRIMSLKYDAVVTNPPYLNRMNNNIKNYMSERFSDYSGDLFSAFIYRNLQYCKLDGFAGYMTPFVWMFIKTYEKLREYIVSEKEINSLIQMEYSAYEEATVPICAFVLRNRSSIEPGVYFRLSEFKGGMEVQKEKVLTAINDPNVEFLFETTQQKFLEIPGCPIAYWVSDAILNAFHDGLLLGDIADCCTGMQTGNNNKYVRYWFEVDYSQFDADGLDGSGKWVKYNCGGDSRKWYGNHWRVVLWNGDGTAIRNEKGSVIRNESHFFDEGISWKRIGSSDFYLRYLPKGFIFDQAGDSMFVKDPQLLRYVLGYVNTKVALEAFSFIAPTLNLTAGNMNKLPVIINEDSIKEISQLVQRCIELEKADWDSFETSWDYKKSPLINGHTKIEESYEYWNDERQRRKVELKELEEKINQIFIETYGVQDYMNPSVDFSQVTVADEDKVRDIKNLISYAVGCMFGRFSIDADGIAYAGGEWNAEKYSRYIPDNDGIIPITDDEYFTDDILNRFVNFIEMVYGSETLEENLNYIASVLDGEGSAREIIRNYFMSGFYADHCKTYQKKPIYWLFESGKKNGFKCLVYIQRYKTDTLARIRTDYVHELQARYFTAINEIESKIDSLSSQARAKANKTLKLLRDHDMELSKYEEKIHHLADQMIDLNMDDGISANYAQLGDILAKIK